jgi:hypothetical protein
VLAVRAHLVSVARLARAARDAHSCNQKLSTAGGRSEPFT